MGERPVGLVLGVDGGNSRTDVVLADTSGAVLARLSGAGTRPHVDGMAATVASLVELVAEARRAGGVPPDAEIACGVFYLANLDTEADESSATWEIAQRGVCRTAVVGNDTLAVLRAGTTDGWGVAVVSGAGVNAVGRSRDGRTEGFLALGAVTGDVGGGIGIGLAALGAAVRAGDGRGPATALRDVLPPVWGCASVEEVAVAAHGSLDRLHVLAPAVIAAAESGDGVARGIVVDVAEEAVVMVVALLRRLDLVGSALAAHAADGSAPEEVPVALAGGLLREPGVLVAEIRRRLAVAAPMARPVVLDVQPVAGAVLGALDAVGAPREAADAVRAALPAHR